MAEIVIPIGADDLMTLIDFGDGITGPGMKEPAECATILHQLPDYTFRDNDVMLCTYAKCGKYTSVVCLFVCLFVASTLATVITHNK